MNTPWRIEMLGWMRAQSGDLTVTRFRTQKTGLLLARLALFPKRTHPREELADVLWPEADQASGRNNLKQSLAILRRLLEPPGTPAGSVLIADRGAVRLNPAAISTDVGDFEAALRDAARSPERRHEALAVARSLYRGELLPGLYDEWVIEERERLTAAWEEASEEAPEPPRDAVPAVTALPDSSAPPAPRLPMTFTRFFGREKERAELAALLADESVRLVTLTGPGGTGKTRLALEAARQAAARLDGRVHFVTLADLADPHLIPEAVADALGLPRTTTGEPLDRVVAALCAAPALLVLDNLEQMGEGAVPPLLALLTRVPSLTILATSRARLFIAGEQEYPLAPLPTPQAQEGQSAAPLLPESLLLFPGVQLFADRARAAKPDFQVTARNAGAVADVCRGLEGIPLALELAAAWSALLTPGQMRARLAERFTLLRSRRKGVAERHQTLQAAIAWSYDLLPPDLALFWARLSVFRGGWTADAAQEVCGEPGALDALGRLRSYSLVTCEDASDGMRFRLLESLREFAASQLAEDERADLSDRHAAHFLRLAESAEPLLTGPDQVLWLNRLGDDQDNLRAALDWDEAAAGEAERGARLAGALWRFWGIRGPLSEARQRLECAARRPEVSAAVRAKVLLGAGGLAKEMGDNSAAQAHLEGSLALHRGLSDMDGVAGALTGLATVRYAQGNYAEAIALNEEALALRRRLGDTGGVAVSLGLLGNCLVLIGETEAARARIEESLALRRALGDMQGEAQMLTSLSSAYQGQGEIGKQRVLLGESLTLRRRLGDTNGICLVLYNLGVCAHAAGDLDDAWEYLRESRELGQSQGFGAHLPNCLLGLATVAAARGDWAQALAFDRECLRLTDARGDRRLAAYVLFSLAEVAAGQGDPVRAARLLGAQAALNTALSLTFAPAHAAEFERMIEAVRRLSSPEATDAAMAEGHALTLEQAIVYALGETPAAPGLP